MSAITQRRQTDDIAMFLPDGKSFGDSQQETIGDEQFMETLRRASQIIRSERFKRAARDELNDKTMNTFSDNQRAVLGISQYSDRRGYMTPKQFDYLENIVDRWDGLTKWNDSLDDDTRKKLSNAVGDSIVAGETIKKDLKKTGQSPGMRSNITRKQNLLSNFKRYFDEGKADFTHAQTSQMLIILDYDRQTSFPEDSKERKTIKELRDRLAGLVRGTPAISSREDRI